MKIEIWSDIACPWCFVGKRRFEEALTRFPQRDALDIVWRSFELDPTAPARQTLPAAELLAKKYRLSPERTQEMLTSMTATGAPHGIAFRFDRLVQGNTFDAHRLIHFAAAHGRRAAMVERLFLAYFSDGVAVGDHAELTRLAGEVGLDTPAVAAMLATDAHATDVRADEARAQEFGISGVPFFAIDERFGVSGAQTADVLVEALQQAWSEQAPVVATDDAASCDDGSCAV